MARSRILQIGLVILHALGLAAAVSNTLPIVMQLALVSLVLLHFAWHWQHLAQYQAIALIYNDFTGWAISKEGESIPIQILPATLLTPFLIIVHYQTLSPKSVNSHLGCFKDALPQAPSNN